jgi:hypothetical protein
VSFSGINLIDFFAHCNEDPDCADDLATVIGAYGINPVLRVPLAGGTGTATTCRGKVITRMPLTAPCTVNPGALFVARGLTLQVDTICVGDQQFVTAIYLTVGNGSSCPVGMDEAETGHNLFTWENGVDGATPIALDAPIPNQNSTDPGVPFNPSLCDSVGASVRGVGGTAVVRFASGACEHPVQYDIAERCDDASQTILVDGDLAPAGHYGITYGDHDYRLTGRTGTGTPVTVTWTEEVCPPDPGKGPFKGIRCRNTGVSTLGPAEVAYFPDPGIGAGNGTLTFSDVWTQAIDGSCTLLVCYLSIRYRPTSEPATPGAPIVAHQAGVTCAQLDLYRCFRGGCPPGVEPDPFDPCAPPDPAWWCPEAEGMGMMAMRGGGAGGEGSQAVGGSIDSGWQTRQAAHLSTQLARQVRAANCRGCGDTGTEGLA